MHSVRESTTHGRATIVLASPAGLAATFAPSVGMVGCSLTHHGEELLGQRGGLRAYADTGSSFGIPLLHPWANRLSGLDYELAGRPVTLDPGVSPIRLDNGLPIHGLLHASPLWQVTGTDEGAVARLTAHLDFGSAPLLAAFPFPHELTLTVELKDERLAIETILRAEGPVPISFGWHPYLTLPGVPRREWEVGLGVRERAVLDDRGIPTGAAEPAAWTGGRLGDRVLDDHYTALAEPAEFSLAADGRRVVVRFDEGYPVAQVFAPAGQDFICFEPMTAPVNALVTGDRLRCERSCAARFSIAVT